MEKLFGTDGIRDTANTKVLTPVPLARLGQAIGWLLRTERALFSTDGARGVPRAPFGQANAFKRPSVRDRVLIGRDTRLSGPMISASLAAGLLSQGVNVVEGGILPTPAIAHVVREMGASLGIVVSASHNPAPDNGIKLISPEGFKIPDAAEERIEALMRAGVPDALTGPEVGDLALETGVDAESKLSNIASKYARDLVDRAKEWGLSLKGMKLVIDCANGATRAVAPWVLEALGAKVVAMGVDPDGAKINDGCGALHPQELTQRVKEEKADLGISFDGDGDRLIVVDDKGHVRDGDYVLAICARMLKAQGKLEPAVVVGTEMSNLGLELSLKAEGIRLVRAKVGDRFVSQAMKTEGLLIGGEQSGHILFFEDSTTGDGLLSALMVLRAARHFGKSWNDLCKCLTRLPQVLKSVRVVSKPAFESVPEIVEAKRKVEKKLGAKGRLVLRYSGTEPVARIMIEGDDQAKIEKMAGEIEESIREALG
ncbi:MAG: phosphoglucosamine mutase [Planctomycetes bacterium]|nr:phosphoglucosamine mutase [Planctomycetota bacterium]